MRLQPHDVRLIVGKRGSGKSHHAKQLCAAEMKGGARIVVYDPHDEYSKRGRKTSQVSLGPLLDRVTVDQLFLNPAMLDTEKLSLAVVPTNDVAAEFAEVAELVAATGGLTFVADEVGEYSDEQAKTLNSVATQSRHYECPVILVAQRLTQIPKTARTQASQVDTFLQSNPEDLEALTKLTGDEDFAVKVSRLPRRKFLSWRDEVAQQ